MKSIHSLWDSLTAPKAEDFDQARQEFLTKSLLLIMAAPLSLATLSILVGCAFGVFDILPVIIVLTLDLPLIIAYRWAYHDRIAHASVIPPAICFSLGLYFTYSSDIISSGLLFTMIAILLAAMLQGANFQWVVAVLSIVGHMLIGVFHYRYPLEEYVAYGIIIGAAFAGTATLIGFYISQLKRAYAKARSSEEQIQILFERVPVGLYRTTPDGRILDANPAMVEMLGFPDMQTLLGTTAGSLYMDSEDRERENMVLEKDGTIRYYQLQLRCYDGSAIWVRDTARVIHDDEGNVICYEGSLEDISEQKKAQERLRFLATHDPLTGLPNRTLLYDRMEQALERAQRNKMNPDGKYHVAVMLLDMDNFKEVNDSHGHATGDVVLQALARRLEGCIRTSDTVARVGGDEFTMVLEELGDPQASNLAAQKVLAALREPFLIDGAAFSLSGSIGISLYPDDGDDIESLLKSADIAMYRAKEKRNCYQRFADMH